MNRTNSPLFLPRRRVLAGGARLLGTLALGPVAGLFADGCARQPKDTTSLGQRLLNVQFEVAGAIASGSATSPYYYLAVINLTNDASDAGPLPIIGNPPGNGIAAPSLTVDSTHDYQTFVGFIEYRTDMSDYTVYVPPIITGSDGTTKVFQHADVVTSYTAFNSIGEPDRFVLPGNGATNTFNATLDLNRIKPPDATTLPVYAQINFITYSYLASTNQYTAPHYYDAIGNGIRTANDIAVLRTDTSGQTISSMNFVEQQVGVMNQSGLVTSATDVILANLQITGWSAVILSQ